MGAPGRVALGSKNGAASGGTVSSDPRDLLRYSHLGLQFVLIVVAFAWGGAWLDRRLGAGGLLTLLCIFAGAAVAFYLLYRAVRRL
jgi:putative F0F1-ATPase subunit (Ca2+/Mg2+ transporter)